MEGLAFHHLFLTVFPKHTALISSVQRGILVCKIEEHPCLETKRINDSIRNTIAVCNARQNPRQNPVQDKIQSETKSENFLSEKNTLLEKKFSDFVLD